jgi:hypothetical protein
LFKGRDTLDVYRAAYAASAVVVSSFIVRIGIVRICISHCILGSFATRNRDLRTVDVVPKSCCYGRSLVPDLREHKSSGG